ncbi:ABC transporter permease [Pseudomonadota bacterium]
MSRSMALLVGVIAFVIFTLPMLLPVELSNPGPRLASPSVEHWFGTDQLGRDIAYRSFLGLIYTLEKGLMVLALCVLVGLLAALISSMTYGKTTDRFLIIIAEAIRSLPGIPLAILFATFGFPVFTILVVFYWIPVWRLLRNLLVNQREKPYILAARLFGLSTFRVLLCEVFPNISHRLIPYLPVILAEIIGVIAALEFLGIGIEVDQPSLGEILSHSIQLGFAAPWSWLCGLFLLVCVIWLLTLLADHSQRRRNCQPLS